MTLLSELRRSLRELVSLLTGAARRKVQAHSAMQYCDGSPRKAESFFGWNRKTVARGIKELQSGTIQVPDSEKRGRPRIESTQPQLVQCAGTVTSDAIVDNLEHWWEQRKEKFPDARTIMIDLDNWPDIQSYRTQFVKRITQLADKIGRTIELVYYPPYHSKYNPIERVWSALERHWNGSLLTTI